MSKATSRSILFSATAVALSAGWSACSASPAAAAPAAAPAATPAAAVTSSGSVRIATANPAHILRDMAETKALNAELGEEQKKIQAADHEKVAAIEDMKSKRDALNPDHPQWADLNSQLVTMTAEYKVWAVTQKAVGENRQKQKMKQLFKKIEDAVGEVAKRDGIDLVITDSREPLPTNLEDIDVRTFLAMLGQRSVLYSSDRADISQSVLTLLDARYRGAAGVPAASAGPYAPK